MSTKVFCAAQHVWGKMKEDETALLLCEWMKYLLNFNNFLNTLSACRWTCLFWGLLKVLCIINIKYLFSFTTIFPSVTQKELLQSLLKQWTALFGFSDFWIELEMKALLNKFGHNGSPRKSSPDTDLDLFHFLFVMHSYFSAVTVCGAIRLSLQAVPSLVPTHCTKSSLCEDALLRDTATAPAEAGVSFSLCSPVHAVLKACLSLP